MKSQRRRRAEWRKRAAKDRLRHAYLGMVYAVELIDPDAFAIRGATREEKAYLSIALDAWGFFI